MEKLKIEKGIEIPAVLNGVKPEEHPYPFVDMEVGDSFLVKCNTSRQWDGYKRDGYNSYYNSLYSRMAAYRKGTSKKFVIRSVSNGFRCWRTK